MSENKDNKILNLGHKLLRFSNYNVHFNINDYI